MVTDTRHDPVQKEYGSLASRYDRKWADYVEATIRGTLRRMPLSPGDRIPFGHTHACFRETEAKKTLDPVVATGRDLPVAMKGGLQCRAAGHPS